MTGNPETLVQTGSSIKLGITERTFRTNKVIEQLEHLKSDRTIRIFVKNMDKIENISKVKRLRNQIDDLRYRYHVLNDPEITDKMYDSLMDELRKIEEKYPELKTSDSPTQRVAGEVLEKFEKVIHTVPQWSFNDAFTQEDIEKWEERIVKMLAKKTTAVQCG